MSYEDLIKLCIQIVSFVLGRAGNQSFDLVFTRGYMAMDDLLRSDLDSNLLEGFWWPHKTRQDRTRNVNLEFHETDV